MAPDTPSKIKSILIELPGYEFTHGIHSPQHNQNFIGREKVIERLMMLLSESKYNKSKSGVYLVAGYRGMGKTSLVHEVIRRINEDNKKISNQQHCNGKKHNNQTLLSINLSLSQDNIKDVDVLKLMAKQLNEKITPLLDKKDDADLIKKIKSLLIRLDSTYRIIDKNEIIITQQVTVEQISREYFTKEVELNLLNILEIIPDKLPNLIFIFDELDKIEPNYFYQEDYSKPQVAEHEFDNIFGSHLVRKRQKVISKLLASLKSFLSSAKARFIFIGGREMYDSALADIADRDSFYSSIFHDVIYIESFFKDKLPGVRGGITQMVEAYVCKLLIPRTIKPQQDEGSDNSKNYTDEDSGGSSQDGEFNLSRLFKYLIELHEEEDRLNTYKLIFFLQNFIIFLAYRSNGTPKKMVSILESYIIKLSSTQIKKEDCIFVEDSFQVQTSEKLGLKFDYHDQYEIGLTANIYRPYMIINSRHLKVLEDKLLYSSAYIMDYLLKFHANAFSWRNLELIPEIILLNKDPNLRFYITDILSFLLNTYIRETITGIFQFRFYNRASHEIKFLTKISEKSAAAFSFTLDESQNIIHYYRRKLHQLRTTYTNYQQEFIYSIAFIEGLLGDLYYFEKEYDEAIVNYSSSVQLLRKLAHETPVRMSYQQIVVYVKNSLHIGLCLEKIKAFDSAYSIYRSLILNAPILFNQAVKNTEKAELTTLEWDKPARRLHLLIKPYVALLDLFEKQRIDGITYANLIRNYEELCSFLLDAKPKFLAIGQERITGLPKQRKDAMRVALLFSDYYHSVGSLLFYKNRNFVELHLILLKVGILEKSNQNLYQFIQQIQGDTYTNYYTPSISGFTYYYLAIKRLVDSYDFQLSSIQPLDKPFTKYFTPNDNILFKLFYLLQSECNGIISNALLALFGNMVTRMGDSLLSSLSLNHLKQFQVDLKIIELFGDFKYNENDSYNYDLIFQTIFDLIKPIKTGDLLINLLNINYILLLYRLAGLFYLKAGKMYSYSFQYRKFLFVFKNYLQYSKKNNTNLPIEGSNVDVQRVGGICEQIAERVFNANTWITDLANRPQILKYRKIFSPFNMINKEETRLIYLNLSNNPEIKETIVLTEEIKLKLREWGYSMDLKHDWVSTNDLITNRYARIYDLKLQSEINHARLKSNYSSSYLKSSIFVNLNFLFGEEIITVLSKNIDKDQALNTIKQNLINKYQEHNNPKFKQLKYLIAPPLELELPNLDNSSIKELISDKNAKYIQDSIFALFEIIRTLNIYGITYICNHSFLANIHTKLADWCTMVENFDFFEKIAIKRNIDGINKNSLLKNSLKLEIGEDNTNYLDSDYHKELAIQHYNSALQMHNGGGTYKKVNLSMSFLEDDFNDNLYHFMAALERLHINTGTVNNHLNELKKEMQFSILYDYDSYIQKDDLSDSL